MRLRLPPIAFDWFAADQYELPDADGLVIPREVTDAIFEIYEDDEKTRLATVTVDAAIIEGHPVCTRLVVEPADPAVFTHGMLRRLGINPAWFAVTALSMAGRRLKEGADGVYEPAAETAWQIMAGVVPKRRTVSRLRLAEVAAAFKKSGRWQDVTDDCHVTRSQAFRLIKKAREAGYLPEEGF